MIEGVIPAHMTGCARARRGRGALLVAERARVEKNLACWREISDITEPCVQCRVRLTPIPQPADLRESPVENDLPVSRLDPARHGSRLLPSVPRVATIRRHRRRMKSPVAQHRHHRRNSRRRRRGRHRCRPGRRSLNLPGTRARRRPRHPHSGCPRHRRRRICWSPRHCSGRRRATRTAGHDGAGAAAAPACDDHTVGELISPLANIGRASA